MFVSFGNPSQHTSYLLTYLLTTTRWCSSPSACYPWCTGRGSLLLSTGCDTTACCYSCLHCVRANPSQALAPRTPAWMASALFLTFDIDRIPHPVSLIPHPRPSPPPSPPTLALAPTPPRRRRFRRLLRASTPRAVGPTEGRPVRHRRQPPVVAHMCGAGHPYVVRRL